MSTLQAIITLGISASGKSTWARQYCQANEGWVMIERDEVRQLIFRNRRPPNEVFTWKAWNWKWEDAVTDYVKDCVREAAEKGLNVILSDTHLSERARNASTKLCQDYGYDVTYRFFPISYHEAVARDTARSLSVGPWVIAKQMDQYTKTHVATVEKQEGLPSCVLIDIDGTVAKMKGRSPFEWDKVGQDEPNEHVWAMVAGLISAGHFPVFLSGRDGVCYKETLMWILKHMGRWMPECRYFDLRMRAEGDMRSDVIVKRELFDEHIRGEYNVHCVIDDRPKVCQMWRELGLEVVQVGNPYIDF